MKTISTHLTTPGTASLLLASLLISVSTLTMSASVLTPSEALARVSRSGQLRQAPRRAAQQYQSTDPTPALTVNTEAGQPALYVFSSGTGFIIASADDAAYPLLGYADEGEFDPSDLSPSMSSWLDTYASAIAEARNEELGPVSDEELTDTEDYPEIPAMLKTTWVQTAPFNDLCPLYQDERTVVGCTATAMSQVMNYHKWPTTGQGSNSYAWNGETLSIDFSAITFDWDNMLNQYWGGYNQEQATAVATLCHAAGMSVNMNYGVNSSGAVGFKALNALREYFDYDASMRFVNRQDYTDAEWKALMYQSLSEGCPILYTGLNNAAGHEFVCDGYDGDNYFHINWGWRYGNGFFLLSALDPVTQGVGGSDAGYNYEQNAIVFIRPNQGGQVYPQVEMSGNFSMSSTTIDLGGNAIWGGAFFSLSSGNITITPGLMVVASDGTSTFLGSSNYISRSLKPDYGWASASVSTEVPDIFAEGTYKVRPAFFDEATQQAYLMSTDVSSRNYYTMTVADGTATFTPKDFGNPEVLSYTIENDFYPGNFVDVKGVAEYVHEGDFYDQIYGSIYDGPTLICRLDGMDINIPDGEQVDFDYVAELPAELTEGTYTFCFTAHVVGSGTYAIISDPTTVEITAAPTTSAITVSNIVIPTVDGVVPMDEVRVNCTITCTEGYFYSTLQFLVYHVITNATGEKTYSATSRVYTEPVYLNAGESVDTSGWMNAIFNWGRVGDTYALRAVNAAEEPISDPVEFVLGDATTGVSAPATADDASVSVQYYDLQGRPVANPSHGLYIKRQGSTTTKVAL